MHCVFAVIMQISPVRGMLWVFYVMMFLRFCFILFFNIITLLFAFYCYCNDVNFQCGINKGLHSFLKKYFVFFSPAKGKGCLFFRMRKRRLRGCSHQAPVKKTRRKSLVSWDRHCVDRRAYRFIYYYHQIEVNYLQIIDFFCWNVFSFPVKRQVLMNRNTDFMCLLLDC